MKRRSRTSKRIKKRIARGTLQRPSGYHEPERPPLAVRHPEFAAAIEDLERENRDLLYWGGSAQ